MRKKFFITLPVFLMVLLFAGALQSYAGVTDSGHGWLWGGGASTQNATNQSTLGWISMNNEDAGTLAQNPPAPEYGVKIPGGDGPLSGYAWSQYYGWLSFNAIDLGAKVIGGVTVPGCTTLSGASRSGNNLQGGFRILSIRDGGANNGGWLGCASLRGTATNGATYGVSVQSDDTLDGYAWSDELGWIDFSGAKIIIPKTFQICPSSPPTVAISQGDSRVFHAYYDSVTGCSAVGRSEVAATWTENDPGAILTLSPASPTKTVTANALADGNSTIRNYQITATYNVPGLGVQTDTVDVVVNPDLPNCACDPTTASNTCTTETFTVPSKAGVCNAQTCNGTKTGTDCGSGFIEVSPTN